MKRCCSRLLLFLILNAVALSCVKDVVMDAKEKPKVVAVCVLNDGPEQELYLSYTKGASLRDPVYPTEAEAILVDISLHQEVGRFQEKEAGIWILEYSAIPAHHYLLEVSVPGYDRLSAEQAMPLLPRICAFGQFFYQIEGLHYPGLIPEIPFIPNGEDFESLPQGVKSYYIQDLPDPVWVFARNYNPKTNRHETAEEICTDYPYVDPFNITGNLYDPPQRTNVPNPYMAGSCVSKLYPQLEGRPLHRGYLHFPSRDLSDEMGYWFTLSGRMEGKYNCKDFYQRYYGDSGLADPLSPDEGYLEVVAVSEDLETYLMDAFHKQEIKTSSDLSTIYLRDNVFSNISGGLGIFGASCALKLQWSEEYEYVDDGLEHCVLSGPATAPNNFYIPDNKWPRR